MIQIALSFPAGRYHATPWASHVNEGEIEWPPSPWRLARALTAVGFSKLGWKEVPELGREVLGLLASMAPRYALPPVATGHTRHYMPLNRVDKKRGEIETAKVIDAFAYPGRGEGAVLSVRWEDVTLRPAQRDLLERLVAGLSYLGRAESWVDARLVEGEEFFSGELCEQADVAPGPNYERVPLLALLDQDAYARWREAALARSLEQLLAKKQHEARVKNRKVPRQLSKSVAGKLRRFFPEQAFDVLLRDTEGFRKGGWRQPPGTRWLSYWRRVDALVPRSTFSRPVSSRSMPTMALLSLASDTVRSRALPLMVDVLPRCEQLHWALVRRYVGDEREQARAWVVTGRQADGSPARGHAHVALHPFGRDDERRMEYVLVHAAAGLDTPTLRALRRVRKIFGDDLPDAFVSVVGVGEARDLAALVPLVRTAHRWRSLTPFVPSRHLKRQPSGSLEALVQAELSSRGKPAPSRIEVEVEGGDYIDVTEFWARWTGSPMDAEGEMGARLASHWRHTKIQRRFGRPQPPQRARLGLRLTFDEPVTGPIALGYGAHFGLGCFTPVVDDEE